MRSSTVLISALAIGAYAVPAFPKLDVKDLANPRSALDSVSNYFNLMAARIQTSAKAQAAAPMCDLSKARMPLIDGLPPPSAGLAVRHVAVGRGTQNFTCDADNADVSPKAFGAVATLFNASCVAANDGGLLELVPSMVVNFNLQAVERLGPMVVPVSGAHYFVDPITPFFDLDTAAMDIGRVPCSKNSSVAAPPTPAVGQPREAPVPWLKLTANAGATGNIKEVYRVNTAGGSPPATCNGMAATFEVQYSAVYWFWESNS